MNIHAKVMVGRQPVWDDETKQRMGNMWNSGSSASIIGALFGVSRNTIIGIATRNPKLFISKKKGAPKYLRTGGKKPRPRDPDEPRRTAAHNNGGHKLWDMHNTRKARMEATRREAEAVASGASPLLQIAPDDAERLNTGTGKELIDLGAHECRFALNNGGPFIFCAEATGGPVYCQHHSERAYRPWVAA
jgi:GcrA cell cycle regulator